MILQVLTPFDLRSAVLIVMLGTVLSGCKPAAEQVQNGKSPEAPKLSAEEQRSREQQLSAFRECESMSLASVKKSNLEDRIEYSQYLNLEISRDQLEKIKPTIPFTYNYRYDRLFHKKQFQTINGVKTPDSRNTEYQHAWVGPYHFRFLPLENNVPALFAGNSEFVFGTLAGFGFRLPEVFAALGVPEKTKDIVRFQNMFTRGKWATHDAVGIAVGCKAARLDPKDRAPWQMKMDEHTTVEDFTKYLSQFPIGASVDWVHTRSLPEMGLEEYRAKWTDKARAELVEHEKNKSWIFKLVDFLEDTRRFIRGEPVRTPVLPKSDYLDQRFYVPSDGAIRKPDNGLPAIFCMGPDNATFNCYVHYFTPENILVQASFSDSQLKFWREIAQFTPQYVNSIRVKE